MTSLDACNSVASSDVSENQFDCTRLYTLLQYALTLHVFLENDAARKLYSQCAHPIVPVSIVTML